MKLFILCLSVFAGVYAEASYFIFSEALSFKYAWGSEAVQGQRERNDTYGVFLIETFQDAEDAAVSEKGTVFLVAVTASESSFASGWSSLAAEEKQDYLDSASLLFQQRQYARDAAAQADKSLARKQAENAFFVLTETVLASVQDPRAGQTPPAKLKFSEVSTLIKSIQDTDVMAAINLSLELLAVDAELKRFDTLWWDTAVLHDLSEE